MPCTALQHSSRSRPARTVPAAGLHAQVQGGAACARQGRVRGQSRGGQGPGARVPSALRRGQRPGAALPGRAIPSVPRGCHGALPLDRGQQAPSAALFTSSGQRRRRACPGVPMSRACASVSSLPACTCCGLCPGGTEQKRKLRACLPNKAPTLDWKPEPCPATSPSLALQNLLEALIGSRLVAGSPPACSPAAPRL